MRAILSLGGNIGKIEETLTQALKSLSKLPDTVVLASSSLYRTKPVGLLNQPDFLNMITEIKTSLSPGALLGACLGIEAALGRERGLKNGPRVIDIDIIFIEGFTQTSYELTLPHPRAMERAFVLLPLAELYPSREVYGHPFGKALDAADQEGIRKLGPVS